MQKNNKQNAYAHFITFRTYGTWLHGDPKFSVHHSLNEINTPKIKPHEKLCQQMKNSLTSEKILLDDSQRNIVLSAIIFACKKYDWHLLTAHVRTNHAHVILKTSITPERSMTQIKAYATRFLRKENPQANHTKLWARHGSTKPIWRPEQLFPVMHYVIEEQGEKMSCYYDKCYEDFSKNHFMLF